MVQYLRVAVDNINSTVSLHRIAQEVVQLLKPHQCQVSECRGLVLSRHNILCKKKKILKGYEMDVLIRGIEPRARGRESIQATRGNCIGLVRLPAAWIG